MLMFFLPIGVLVAYWLYEILADNLGWEGGYATKEDLERLRKNNPFSGDYPL